MRVDMQTHSGYKADERPTGFMLNGRQYRVKEVCDQWLGPDSAHFKVRADDRNFYIFAHDLATDEWTLAAFRSSTDVP